MMNILLINRKIEQQPFNIYLIASSMFFTLPVSPWKLIFGKQLSFRGILNDSCLYPFFSKLEFWSHTFENVRKNFQLVFIVPKMNSASTFEFAGIIEIAKLPFRDIGWCRRLQRILALCRMVVTQNIYIRNVDFIIGCEVFEKCAQNTLVIIQNTRGFVCVTTFRCW